MLGVSRRAKKELLIIYNFNFLNLEILVINTYKNESIVSFIVTIYSFINEISITKHDKTKIRVIFVKYSVLNRSKLGLFYFRYILPIKSRSRVAGEKWLGSSFTRYAFCFHSFHVPRCDLGKLLIILKTLSSKVAQSAKKIVLQLSKGKCFTNSYCNYCRIRLILSNDIESNPGPIPNNLVISSYNLQGCGDKKKLKRINSILHKLPYKFNCIFNLQETHFTNKSDITYHWKWGSILSNGTSNSCGVAILYNATFFDDIIETDRDMEGRFCSLYARKDGETYLFVNVYAPNDHSISLEFFEYVQNKLELITARDPLVNIIIAGDFNFVFDPSIDSIGRKQTNKELELVKSVESLMIRFNLCDSYRIVNNYGGFTWGKNNPKYLRSRLDHILIHKNLSSKIVNSNVTYEYNESDHQYLSTEILIDSLKFGPGIQRVNATLLNDPEIKDKVTNELNNKLLEIPLGSNPHQILDFFKFSLRTIMLREGKEQSKIDKNRLELSNIEINRLKTHLDNKLLEYNDILSEDQLIELTNIKDSIEFAELEIADLKEQESKRLIFKSRAKWAEEGEKSNKYFLNLLKDRQKQMQIRKLVSNGSTFYKQDEISKAIHLFYKRLYEKQKVEPININDKLFKDLPKLNDSDKQYLETPLSLEELYKTLLTCNESAPGPDGITYDTYKHLWPIAGPILLKAWQHSCRIGSTSGSQRQAVISLLEKKGKDRTIIENLRPISLSNCDIKLCTKALALRTNSVLNKLINITQAGYVPGRQVTDNIRLLEEIIERANEIKEKAYLVTLDAQKAFDSVDHNYLFKILEIYGFPPTYINCIKLLYKNLNATVLVNGYTTEWFRIEQSVKQGDALSCALFLLSIEPLINSIRKNKDIIPIKITSATSNESCEINEFSFADDITSITTSREAIQIIIDEYNHFSSFSGIKLNVPKTEIMILGKRDNETDIETFEIKTKDKTHKIVEQNNVKICGICFSNDKSIAYKENIETKITKLERKLDIWRSRNLTLSGKILIVKTFGLSQLIYSLQSTSITPKDLVRIDSIVFRFIWSIKKSSSCNSGKIARNVLMSNYESGGLKAPSIKAINDSIKYKSLLRHLHINSHPVSILYNNKKHQLGFNWQSYSTIQHDNTFIGCAIKVHVEIGKYLLKDIKDISNNNDGIHKNYYSHVQNTSLFNNPFVNIHQQSLITRLAVHNINTFIDLHNARQQNRFPNLFLEIFQIYNTFPLEWRALVAQTNRIHPKVTDQIPLDLNKWVDTKNIKTSDLTEMITKNRKNLRIESLLATKHKENINTQANPFLTLRLTLKDQKLRNIQYKILHNIYPTMKHLYYWKIKDSPNCNACNTTETLKHAIFECPIAITAWDHFKNILNLVINCSYNDILLGFCATNNLNVLQNRIHAIDTLMVLVKQRLILQRENKVYLNYDNVFSLINERVKLEKYNSLKYGNKIRYSVRWKWIEERLEDMT